MIKLKNKTKTNLISFYESNDEKYKITIKAEETKRFDDKYANILLKDYPNDVENRTEIENNPDYLDKELKKYKWYIKGYVYFRRLLRNRNIGNRRNAY